MAEVNETKEASQFTPDRADKIIRAEKAKELREVYAGQALNGILANPNNAHISKVHTIEKALEYADALLVALGYEAPKK